LFASAGSRHAPAASESDRKTAISVSAGMRVRCRVNSIARAKSVQKANSETYGRCVGSPSNSPSATPVIAAWPTACAKNASRFVTTSGPTPPSRGPSSSAHTRALTTKP